MLYLAERNSRFAFTHLVVLGFTLYQNFILLQVDDCNAEFAKKIKPEETSDIYLSIIIEKY